MPRGHYSGAIQWMLGWAGRALGYCRAASHHHVPMHWLRCVKTANTGDKTVVLLSDFYRQGDGNIESFTAKMIVSDSDLDPIAPGVQNVWIQGIGCATGAITNFN